MKSTQSPRTQVSPLAVALAALFGVSALSSPAFADGDCEACAQTGSSSAEEQEYEVLPIDLPNPVFAGTPAEIPEGAHMEEITGEPRNPTLVPVGLNLENVALDKPVDASDDLPLIGRLDLVTNGDKEALDGRFVELAPGRQWIQIDLEDQYEIHFVLWWFNHIQARVYHGVVVKVSNDPDFEEDVTVLFNNDYENTHGFGAGEDFEYFESFEGKLAEVEEPINARYVRVYSNGNTMDDQNHFTEVEVWARPVQD